MVVSILPVGGQNLPSATSSGAAAAAVQHGLPGAANNTKIVQSGQQTSGSASNNARGNAFGNDQGDGGENTQIARALTQEKVVLPAPPADELETPVAPQDLLRYANSRPEPVETPVRNTGLGAKERLNDDSLSASLTPPAEERISEDIAMVRSMIGDDGAGSIDVKR